MKPGLRARFAKRFAAGPTIQIDQLEVGPQAGITVLFGASGSGKTTILRCLAGLERPEEGSISHGDDVWFDSAAKVMVPPRRRNLGFVPQDYALFPHLTLHGNIDYGLHHLPAAERRRRVNDALAWLGLEGLGNRRPSELSGGQQQRAALARAVVRRPQLLLMDEPLSSLDGPTRQRLRSELRSLLARLQIPTLLVTHDRLEAMVLGDSLVVLHQGRMIQSGPANEVFNRPANLEVAGIVGVETVHPGRVAARADDLVTVRVREIQLTASAAELPPNTEEVFVCIRAEDVILMRTGRDAASARNRLPGTVQSLAAEGALVRVNLDVGFPLKALLTRQACEELAIRPGESIHALVKAPHIHLLPRGA